MAEHGLGVLADGISPGGYNISSMARVYIGLGSNLDEPLKQLNSALEHLAGIPEITLLEVSSFYRSKPVGPRDQPDYINAVALLETDLTPEALLDQLQAIEDDHGRERKVRWGARTLDLDILLVEDVMIRTTRLIVPHPQMHHRSFVLFPLDEIAPAAVIPGQGIVRDLLEKIDTSDLCKITKDEKEGS